MGKGGLVYNKRFRLSYDDKKLLETKATKYQVSESEYLRMMIRGEPENHAEIEKDIKQLINEVNRVGNNINQVVRNNNSSLYNIDDKDRLFAYMKKVYGILAAAVQQYGN